MSGTTQPIRRGRPRKYPRPPECPHNDRAEHARGVCYQCSSNINNQKKREKKIPAPLQQAQQQHDSPVSSVGKHMKSEDDVTECESLPKKRKTLYGFSARDDPIEINVGGIMFATTYETLTNREKTFPLLLDKKDLQGRIFVDRDGTHFRWILNYLRDGKLVTLPSHLSEKLELLQEANYYQIINLCNFIRASIPGTKNNDISQQETPTPSGATFLTARPSTKGIFFLTDLKWTYFFPNKGWECVAVRFEESKAEVTFFSLHIDTEDNKVKSTEICLSKLEVEVSAKAIVLAPEEEEVVEAHFWWIPSSSPYPQLYARFTKNNGLTSPDLPMEFLRTSPEPEAAL